MRRSVQLLFFAAFTAAVSLPVTLLAGAAYAQKPLSRDRTSTAAADFFGGDHGAGARLDPGAGMPEIDSACNGVSGAEEFGGTPIEQAAWCLNQRYGPDGERKLVGVRTLADRALRENPSSFRAHFLMGVAQHQGEGNLPKAIYHLERAAELFVQSYGRNMVLHSSPWRIYQRTLIELVYVHGEMDHHEDKIRYVDLLRDLGFDLSPLKAWPLLKLKRFEEARLMVDQALTREEDPYFRAVAMTALCAIESEQRHREKAYEACKAAAEPAIADSHGGGAIELSNAAAAASEMFHFDEAERLYTLATRRQIEGSVNPWGRLTRLYLRQGRFSEALSAWREMVAYRKRRPAYLDQQDQSDADLIGVSVLTIAGRTKDALPITERTLKRPDRQGTSSAHTEQNEAGAAVMDRVVKLDLARQLEEEASVSTFFDALKLRVKALQLRVSAWVDSRRAAEVLAADHDRLVTSLRPECPGSIELPEWLDAEVVHVVGPGVALAAIAEARAEETLPPELSELIFRALQAEAELAKGEDEAALDGATFAIEHLPATEVLLRARSAAVGARAARNLKRYDRALELYGTVMASDPGAIRRMGLTLPVSISAASPGPEIEGAIQLLKKSPLFDEEPWGFELRIDAEGASLLLADGTEVARVSSPAGKAASPEVASRRIARAVHKEILVPNVDITQADIHSLDGSLGSGGRASERAKSVLDEVLEPR